MHAPRWAHHSSNPCPDTNSAIALTPIKLQTSPGSFCPWFTINYSHLSGVCGDSDIPVLCNKAASCQETPWDRNHHQAGTARPVAESQRANVPQTSQHSCWGMDIELHHKSFKGTSGSKDKSNWGSTVFLVPSPTLLLKLYYLGTRVKSFAHAKTAINAKGPKESARQSISNHEEAEVCKSP